MALPASDSFTQGGAGHGALSASWTTITGEGAPQVNQTADVVCLTSVGTDAGAYWNADSFNTDHYSQIDVVTAAAASVDFVSAAVRVQSGARQYYKGGCYGAIGGSVTYEIGKRNGATNSVLKSGSATINANDTLRLEVSGTTLTLKNITTAATIDTTTDVGGFTGGAPGIFLFVDSGTIEDSRLDNWVGDNLAAAGGAYAAQATMTMLGVQ